MPVSSSRYAAAVTAAGGSHKKSTVSDASQPSGQSGPQAVVRITNHPVKGDDFKGLTCPASLASVQLGERTRRFVRRPGGFG